MKKKYLEISKLKYLLLLPLIYSLLSYCGNQPSGGKSSEKEKIVAVVENRKISLLDIKKNIEILPDDYKIRFRTYEDKKNLLHDLITTEMLFLAGKEKNLDTDEKIVLRLDNLRKWLVRDLYISRYIKPRAIPTDDDISKYYVQHKNDKFFKKGYIDVRYIKAETPKEAQQVYNMLKIYKFEEIIRKKLNDKKGLSGSDAPLRIYKDGEITGIGNSKELADAAFLLNFLEISKPIKTPNGIFIIKLIGKENDRYVDLDTVKGSIKETLQKENFLKLMDKEISALENKYNVKTFPELLK